MAVGTQIVLPARPPGISSVQLPPPAEGWASVKTYAKGWLRIQPWLAMGLIFLIHGGALLLYELVFLNVEDRDARDMLADQVLTLPAIQRHHKHFRSASWRSCESGTIPCKILNTAKFEGSQIQLSSDDLPLVMYEWSPDRCMRTEVIPCFASDHADRSKSAGPLNDGSDVGTWAVDSAHSVRRYNSSEGLVTELIEGITYKFATFEQFGGRLDDLTTLRRNMDDFSEIERKAILLSAVPPNKILSVLIGDPGNPSEWTTADWWYFFQATFARIKVEAMCPRQFDLCTQTIHALQIAADSLAPGEGRIHRHQKELDKVDGVWPVPVLRSYRNRELKDENRPNSGGYVSKASVLHFVAEALRKYPAPKKYTVPTRNGVPKPLSEVLRINGDSTLLELEIQNYAGARKFASGDLKPLWFWPGSCSGTEVQIYTLAGNAFAINRSAYAIGKMPPVMTVEALTERREIALLKTDTDFDSQSIRVATLSKVEIVLVCSEEVGRTVNRDTCAWRLHSTRSTHKHEWDGPLLDAPARFPSSQVGFEVIIRDLSEPTITRFPEFTGNFRVLAALLCGGFFAMVFLSLPYWAIKIHGHVMENNNLPPIFYRHTLSYRGW
mmetsp:Transcript_22711/g.43415  ORF Transcript_22711/g.43415 Transcript_22711/m.43415 type:complete len:610 (-) Transcript_22711:118-1947(-)